jgi:hypothetical protein
VGTLQFKRIILLPIPSTFNAIDQFFDPKFDPLNVKLRLDYIYVIHCAKSELS